MHLEWCNMPKTDTCLKCGSTAHELKTIVLPTKKTHESQVGVDMFYLKICTDCGYTEMYSAKAIDKIKKTIPNFSK